MTAYGNMTENLNVKNVMIIPHYIEQIRKIDIYNYNENI